MITVSRWRKGATGEYIGRAMRFQGLKGSPLGNPYRLDEGVDRSVPIERYRRRLLAYLAHDTAEKREIERLTELARQGDLTLLCWCKEDGVGPSCHGDVVKAIIEARLLD